MVGGARAQAEELHRLAIDAAELGTLRHDVEGDVFHLSDRARQHFGVGGKTAALADLLGAVVPRDATRMRATATAIDGVLDGCCAR